MKSYRILIVTILVIFVVMLPNRAIYSSDLKGDGQIDLDETVYDKEAGVRITEGMRFSIAEDRKVVHYGSLVEPEGLDKYLGKKMDKMNEILESVLNRLVKIESRIEALESSTEQLSKQIATIDNHQALRSTAPKS